MSPLWRSLLAAAAVFASGAAAAAAQDSPRLTLPLACTLGIDCFIQQYVDLDAGPGVLDYRCGQAAYDGHSGTDFRVLSITENASVPVLASAAGRVKGARDGMADRLLTSPADEAAVKDRECGNGVVIDHGGGWETQYCHLRRGSVTVREGDEVAAGAALGMVGYSGRAQFAHVHLSVRHHGQVVDPFTGKTAAEGCQKEPSGLEGSLWSSRVHPGMGYSDAAIIEVGFSGAPVTPAEAETGKIAPAGVQAAALTFYVRLINLRAGDRMELSTEGPGGFRAAQAVKPLESRKAHYVAFAGRKRSAERWPSGLYRGSVRVLRDTHVIAGREVTFEMP